MVNRMVRMSSVSVTALVALALSFLHPSVAAAGTITFNDLTDTVTFSTDVGRVSAFNCSGGEVCVLTLLPPVFPNGGTTWGGAFDIFGAPGTAESGLLSDTLLDTPTFDANFNILSFKITFTSDTEGGPPLVPTGGNRLTENGTIQTADNISWPNGVVVDTIKFQSDSPEVPEPSTMVLMLVAFVGLGARGRWAAFRRAV